MVGYMFTTVWEVETVSLYNWCDSGSVSIYSVTMGIFNVSNHCGYMLYQDHQLRLYTAV